MTSHATATRQEWLAARLDLLEAEKDLTRRSDDIARRRRQLPWVRIDKDYRFDTENGAASLKDLFRGRSQLLVYHFMFGPDYKAGCTSCSAIADGFNGIFIHLENHDVAFTAVSRAPLAKLLDFRNRMDWSFPWASSFGGDFNYDFAVAFTEAEQYGAGIEYNYSREPAVKRQDHEGPLVPTRGGAGLPVTMAGMSGTDPATYARERPGVSAFVLEDDAVYHSYSAFSRGVDDLWAMYKWLDRAPKGRNEAGTGVWFRHHDRYGEA